MATPFISKSIQNPQNSPYLDWIKFEEKQFEGRLKTKIEEWDLKIGRRIKFYDEANPDSWVLVTITSLPTFPDFGTAFDTLGSKLIPGRTRDEVISLYNSLFHYPDEVLEKGKPSKMIQDNGVVAIGFKIDTSRP